MEKRKLQAAEIQNSQQQIIIQEHKIPLQLATPDDFQGFFKQVRNMVGDLGFSDFSMTYFNHGDMDCEPFSTMPPELMRDYQKGGFFQHDCAIQYASKEGVRPIFKSVIDQWVASSPVESDFVLSNLEELRLSRAYGYEDHYLLPLKSCAENSSLLFTVSRKKTDISAFRSMIERCKDDLVTIAVSADYIGGSKYAELLLGRKQQPTIRIPSRPLKVIDLLVNHDLSIKQAAEVMHISEGTAKRYVAQVKDLLGCKRLNRAIAKALSERLIIFSEN